MNKWCKPLIIFFVGLASAPQELLAEGIPEPPLVFYGEVRNNAGGLNVRITAGALTCTLRPSDGGAPVVATAQLTNINDQFSYLLLVPCETKIAGRDPSPNVLSLTAPPLTYAITNMTLTNAALGHVLLLVDPSQRYLPLPPANRGLVQRIDLIYVGADLDSDGDGLPDWWETLYPTARVPTDDTDRDGMNNWKEYRAGTDPTDPASVFEFIDIRADPLGGTIIRWASVANKKYTVLRASGFSLNAADYLVIHSGIASTPPLNSYVDPSPPAGSCFYRLQVE